MKQKYYSVLLCDDNPRVTKALKHTINWEKHGCQVIDICGEGLEADRLMDQKAFDLVITDIRMPGIDGIDLIRRSRAREEQTVFIMITGYEEFEYARQAFKLDALDFITKPINYDELERAIEKGVSVLKGGRRSDDHSPSLFTREESEIHLLTLFDNTVQKPGENAENISSLMNLILRKVEGLPVYRNISYLSVPYVMERMSINGLLKSRESCRGALVSYLDVLALWLELPDLMTLQIYKALLEIYLCPPPLLSLSVISQMLNLNESYTGTILKQMTGMNFRDLSRKRRIDLAKRILTGSNKSIQSIANDIGYADYRYFETIFKAETEQTPSAFRNVESNPQKRNK